MDGCFVSGWLAVLFAVVCPSVGEGLGTGPGLGLDARIITPMYTVTKHGAGVTSWLASACQVRYYGLGTEYICASPTLSYPSAICLSIFCEPVLPRMQCPKKNWSNPAAPARPNPSGR